MNVSVVFKIVFPLAVISILTGCAQKPQALYNFGGYSESYYAYEQEPGKEKLLELQKAIEEAIAHADQSVSKRVPPGMYANLGYIYLKQGKTDDAIQSFEKEKSIYPESAHFMNRIINKIQMTEESAGSDS